VRYKQTLLGAAWAVLQPGLMMVVFTFFFGRLAHVSSGGVDYAVFVYAGLVPWTLFASAITSAGNSVVGSERLITKVYFPRLAVPLASVGSAVVDSVIACGLLLVLMLCYGIVPGVQFLLAPLMMALIVLAAVGVGTLLAALNVAYRDFRYVIPFLTQFWMFASPVAYPSSLVPQVWRLLYGLNPMGGVIEGFRWALLNKASPSWELLAVSTATVVVLLTGGLFYFQRMESRFADLV
jgi:lipopolysaccharide transport system permease protein